jgi:hypothetical protein
MKAPLKLPKFELKLIGVLLYIMTNLVISVQEIKCKLLVEKSKKRKIKI